MSYPVCQKCEKNELPLSDVKGYEHLCLACEAEQMANELEDQWNKELAIFKERTGRDLNFDQFYYNCGIDIDPNDLKGLPELKLCYDDAIMNIEYYNQDPDPQTELDFDGLPF